MAAWGTMSARSNSARKKPEQSNGDRNQPVRATANIFAADAVQPTPLPADAENADAAALQALLREHIEPGASEAEAAPETSPQPEARPGRSRLRSRLTKSLLGLALVAIAGWMPAQRLFEVQSVEAVVNAPIVTVRAPIAGVVGAGLADISIGQTVDAGTPLAALANPRANRDRLDTAIAELGAAGEERDALAARQESLIALRADLATQLAAFRSNRLRQIDARIAETDARIAGAEAVATNAVRERQRKETLLESGFTAGTVLEDVKRDSAVAAAAADEARAARAALIVERDALRDGSYLGDSYNDQPRSAQRIDEIDQQLAAISADLQRQESRLARAEAAVKRERGAYALVRAAELDAPVGGRVWEVFTAPGEQVTAGQPLFSLLNCSQTLVTAAVSEAVYNTLSVGMPAEFHYREGGAPVAGHVVQLSGVAAASSNLAIMASALKKETYRVAVALDGAPGGKQCPIGRTGRVVFDTK